MTKIPLAFAMTLACAAAVAAQSSESASTAQPTQVVKRAASPRVVPVNVRKRPTTISYISPRIRSEGESAWSTPLFQQARPLR